MHHVLNYAQLCLLKKLSVYTCIYELSICMHVTDGDESGFMGPMGPMGPQTLCYTGPNYHGRPQHFWKGGGGGGKGGTPIGMEGGGP